MKQIFTISGNAMAGKDTTANFLKTKLHGSTLILHFADYLKIIARKYLGWDGNKDKKGRTILQWLGTDRVRVELNKPLFWATNVCDTIEIVYDEYDFFCIPDCRFPNEIFYPKSRFPGFVTSLQVIRANFDNGLTEKQKQHSSEIALDNFKFDYIIESKSGLDYLEKAVDRFLISGGYIEE